MNDPIWFSIDENLRTRDRGTVGLAEALATARRYVEQVRPFYETGEEAASQTDFGFSRSETEFIEICVFSRNGISIRIELPNTGISRFWRPVFQHDETVKALDALEERVCQFFGLTASELRSQLR